MQLYAVSFITWTAIVIASSASNVVNFSNEKVIGYTELHDSPVKQIVQPYATRSLEERNSGHIDTEDRSNDATNESAKLSRPVTTRAESASGSNGISTIDPVSYRDSSIYATPLTEVDGYLFRESPDGESGYAIPEDVLLVESAGAFGQKVHQDPPDEQIIAGQVLFKTSDNRPSDESKSFWKSISSTVPSFNKEDNQRNIHVSTARKPLVLALKQETDLPENSPSEYSRKPIGSDLSTKNLGDNVLVRSSTESSSSRTNGVSVFDNDVIPEYLPTPQARSSRARNTTEGTSEKAVVVPTEKPENITTTTYVEISSSLQPTTKFLGPIVVADLPVQKNTDATIDYVDKGNSSKSFRLLKNTGPVSETNVRSSKAATSNFITSSSLMLNPLQVGITLMNAGGLVGDSELSAATETKDYFQDDLQQRSVSRELENKGNYSDVRYKDEKVQHDEREGATEIVTQRAPDNSVEIQKSVELYHTAPVHEIHYPVEYIQQMTHLGVIESNSIGNAHRSRQPFKPDGPSGPQLTYDAYQGNDATEKPVIKGQIASAQKFNRQQYNILEDDIGKPAASALIAEYSSNTHERVPVDGLESQPLRYNEMRPTLLAANQFDDALYEQSNGHHTPNNNDNNASLHTRLIESPPRNEPTNELVKPYVTTSLSYQEQQPQSVGQPINQHHSFRSQLEGRKPQEQPAQLLLKIIPNGAPADGGFLVPIPRPYPIEKIIEKTVHVPHPVEVEKVIEKKVQVPVPVPQPYPVHVHVPVDRLVEKQIRVQHLYPIHIERVTEKRIPYTVQRLLLQPAPSYPLHLRSPTPYPVQMGVPFERPAHVTTPVERPTHLAASSSLVEQPATPIEKIAEKPLTGTSWPPRPYRTDTNRDGSIETRHKYQQRLREPILGGENLNTGYGGNVAFESQSNTSQFYGDVHSRFPLTYDQGLINDGKYHVPAATHLSGNVRLMIVPKKFGSQHTVLLRPHTTASTFTMLPVTFRRQVVYNLVEKDKVKNDYVGPLPPRKIFVSQTKSLPDAIKPILYSTSVTQSPTTTIGSLRRTRQPEAQYPGSFRQSKMEYGFKPPMVPSVQYDENTASKVDN